MIRDIQKVQGHLKAQEIDAWVIYQFIDLNPIFKKFLGETIASRRTFLIIPQKGEATIFHSSVDGNLGQLGLREVTYTSYEQFSHKAKEAFAPYKKIAMEFSPLSQIPHISRVDGGIIDFLRTLGLEIISSGDLIQAVAGLSQAQVESHLRAAKAIDQVRVEFFDRLKKDLRTGVKHSEYSIQQLLLKMIEEGGYETIYEPDTVINENSAKSHYAPTKDNSKQFNLGDLLLVDFWLKEKGEDTIYADITWMLYRGEKVPDNIKQIFQVAAKARDLAIEFLKERVKEKSVVRGWEVDKVARDFIEQEGFGPYFTHRLGHSIGTFIHGELVHLDNFENKDDRQIFPNHITSVEPGIYLPGKFGVRAEVNILVKDDDVIVTTQPQIEIILLP